MEKIINENEYECALCGCTFGLVRDETWNDEKAKKEAVEEFGYYDSDMVKVCDDCFNKIKPSNFIIKEK